MSAHKYYYDKTRAPWVAYAFAADGSEDMYIPSHLIPMTKDEEAAHINPLKTLQEIGSAAMALVNAEYTKRMGAIADAYPLHERESWPVQLQEARMVMDYVDANVPVPETIRTPWIDQCAAQRGLTREELAARIVAKDAGYRQISGFLSGVRQKHEDEIATLLAAGEESREALQDYWYLEGWDVEPATDLQTPQST